MATKFQREIAAKLKGKGFLPAGFDGKGQLILEHAQGARIPVSATPSDSRYTKNLIGDADRALNRRDRVHEQFLHWLWRKWDVEPGSSKLVQIALQKEAAAYLRDDSQRESYGHGNHRTVNAGALTQWARSQPWIRNTDPTKKGPGERVWEISRPLDENPIVTPLRTEDLLDFADEVEDPRSINKLTAEIAERSELDLTTESEPPDLQLEGDQREAERRSKDEDVLLGAAPPAADAPQFDFEVVKEPGQLPPLLGGEAEPVIFDPALIEQIRKAVAGTLVAQNQHYKDTVAMVTDELPVIDEQIQAMIDQLIAMRKTINGLRELM